MVVPLIALSVLRGERSQRASEVVSEVAGSWAGEQTLIGPVLLLPYVARGGDQNDMRTVRRTMVVLPETMKQDGDITTEGAGAASSKFRSGAARLRWKPGLRRSISPASIQRPWRRSGKRPPSSSTSPIPAASSAR